MAEIAKLIKDLKKEANKFKNNIGEIEDILKDVGKDTIKNIDKGVDYVKKLPEKLLEEMLKLFKKLGKILGNVFGDGLVIFFKILFVIVKKIYGVMEKNIPGFFMIKYVLFVILISQINPLLTTMSRLLSYGVGQLPAALTIYGATTFFFFYIYMNFGDVVKTIGGWFGDVKWGKIITDAAATLGPEIAKIFEKIGKEIAKIF